MILDVFGPLEDIKTSKHVKTCEKKTCEDRLKLELISAGHGDEYC